jgi:S1-C subfamily serine protease
MRTYAKGIRLSALCYGVALAGCASEPPNMAIMTLPRPSMALSEPSPPANPIPASIQDHDDQVARALHPRRPPGVEGLKLVATGSGFFIAPDKVLTNFHVAGPCMALTVGNNSEGEETDAKLIAGNSRLDLAVLSTDTANVTLAQFQTSIPEQTEGDLNLTIVGYPEHGLPVLLAEANPVTVFQDDLQGNRERYTFYGPVRRGNSGGPVLDSSGAVIGVVTAKIDTIAVYQKTGSVVDDVGIAIANRTVFNFLATNKIDFESATPKARLSPEELLREAHGFVRQIGCWK